jgi:hypothetical protein
MLYILCAKVLDSFIPMTASGQYKPVDSRSLFFSRIFLYSPEDPLDIRQSRSRGLDRSAQGPRTQPKGHRTALFRNFDIDGWQYKYGGLQSRLYAHA